MKERTETTLTFGSPLFTDEEDNVDTVQRAMPHIAAVAFDSDGDSDVSIRVGTRSAMTKHGVSECSGNISMQAARNLHAALTAMLMRIDRGGVQ